MLFPLLNPVAKCFAIVIRHECEPPGERANRVFPFVCDSFLPSSVRNERAKHGAIREDLRVPARCRNAARDHLCGHGFWATLFK